MTDPIQEQPLVWANRADYNDAKSGHTRVAAHQITLTSLADGAARQGSKASFGEDMYNKYAVRVGIEFDVAPTAGEAVYVYWSASIDGTPATGNDGGCTGADAAYKAGDEEEWVNQLTLIGVLTVTADAAATVQYATIGSLEPPTRYGQIVVWNKSGEALEGDSVEMFVALIPDLV